MVAWLGLQFDAGGWTLADSGGMRQILDAIDCPHRQYPSIPLFIGQATKVQALRSLYPYHNIGRHGKVGFARLHLSSTAASYPVIVIESSHTRNSRAEPSRREPACQYHIQNCHDWSYQDIQDLLYRHGLLPLTDVLCLFAADLGGCSGIQELLGSWSSAPLSGLDGTNSIRPRLVIVLTDPEDGPHHSAVIESALKTAAMPNLAASVTVVDLRGRNELSPASRFEPLRRQLSLELDTSRAVRSKAHLLFSAVHLEWIFRNLLRHVAHRPTIPFNCIQACRGDQGEEIAGSSLRAFLDIVKQAGLPYQSVVTFVASAFLMDAYPPGMHEFDPRIVFRHLYAGPCATACRSSTPAHARRFCRDLEAEFAFLFNALSTSASAQIRRAVLRREVAVWATVKSAHICLFCLRRPPEHVLPCGHAICDICVCIFGSRARGAEYHFDLSACPACFKTFSLTVRLLPPTKRPTILVLDGGGIRGVVTLGFLKALEEQIGGSRGLREAFDLTVGTSAGAVIASEVIVRGVSIDEAYSKFNNLARQIFPSRPRRYTILGQSLDLLTTWMTDSRYDSDTLDRALQEAFGPTRRLFDTTIPLVSGIRVALTASQVKDGSLCLCTNYRAAGRCNTQSAHSVLTSKHEPLLWEVARCSVAALGYFTPKCLAEAGTLQDGGIRANCPLRPALRESEIIWPSATRPDLVVSIGTGYAAEGPAAEDHHHQRHDGFIERAIRTFLCSPAVDGRRGWQDALDSVPAAVKKDVFRLDRAIPGKLPELDDARALDELGEFEYRIPDELTRAWLAKSFFFELDQEPILGDGIYDCQGSILCCKYDVAGIIQQIMARLPNARFMFSEGRDLGAVNVADGCPVCGYYRKRVSFQVSSIYESVNLGVHGMTGSCALGGFPTTLQDLLEAQQVDSPFGRADHRCNQWPPSRQCYCTGTGKKRALASNEPQAASKRRRLWR
ncbi:hypothetical protein SI65_06007 [Aspergillus cristatus]|uniref:PNPLA domain-containing protein n=1 Tax=Aspergillus cristatus TaxID=573508 RepID=A0A1E3BCL9_ASPCR|nr:hypothetical protein SI65_06007 [Aspergillus cristatus]